MAAKHSPDELVRIYLRGQNLEQLGRVEEAIGLYEMAVAAGFDASGPYDRLLLILEERGRHHDVLRVARTSLEQVRTYQAKRKWYEGFIERAEQAIAPTFRPR